MRNEKSEIIRVLLIEDNPGDVRLIREMLAEAGRTPFEIECASRLSTGLERLVEGDIDVVLLDLGLPDSQGLETFVRVHSQAPEVPVVVLTDLDDEALAVQAVRKGVQDYLVKGQMDANPLVHALRYAIERRRIEEMLRQRNRDLALLNRLGQELTATLDLQQLTERLLQTVIETIGAEAVSVWLRDEERKSWLVCQAAFPPDQNRSLVNLRLPPGQGIAGWVAREEKSAVVANVQDDPRFFPDIDEKTSFHTISLLAVPLRARGKVIGVLEVVNKRDGGFDEDNRALVEMLAASAAIAIQNAHLVEALRQRNRELALLNHASQALSSTLDLDQVLITVLEEARHLLGVIACSVWLADPTTNELVCRHATGSRSEIMHGWRLAPGEGIVGWVNRSGESLIVPDAQADERHFKGIDQQTGQEMRSILSVPLRVKENVIGVIEAVDAEVDRFKPTDLRLVEPLAVTAAIAIENARLYVQAQQEIAERKRVQKEREKLIEELDAFAHTVAHDLKSPLCTIVSFADMLEKDYATIPDEEIRDYLQMIVRGGHKVSSIVDELLLLAGVRKMAEVEMRPSDVASIVADAQQRLAHIIEKHQAEIILPDTWPAALGYGPWVEEVWVNYLSNAIKYGGQPPRVELGATKQPDGMVRFWVRDNGPGLTPEEQARLFTPFTRLDQICTKGHGLGLSIVCRIMEKLGGQVGVESEVGQGSVFAFTLPATASEQ